MYYDYDEERYILEVPTECPECEEKLELDPNPDGTVFLLCPKCDYKLDVTEEFRKLEEAEQDEEEERLREKAATLQISEDDFEDE